MPTVQELKAQLAEAERKEAEELNRKIKAYIQRKDTFIKACVNQFIAMQKELIALKTQAFHESAGINELMYKLYDRTKPENAKSFTIQNEDKTMKIVAEDSTRLTFAPEANVGLEMIYECLKDKYASRNKKMYTIIDTILKRKRAGNYDPRMLVDLRELEKVVDDERYSKALKILTDNQILEKTGVYVRVSIKDKLGKWEDVSLQFSSLKI